MTRPMRIAFFGSGEFGVPTLRALAQEHTLVGIVTQPDKPAGRGGSLTPTPVGQTAGKEIATVPLIKPIRCNAAETVTQIRGWNADACVVIAFGQKLGKELLEGVFAMNLHASILPRWRGAAPIHAAIVAGDTHTGNSVITLADRMDAGEVLASSRSLIGESETAGELHDRLSVEGPEIVTRVLVDFGRGQLDRRAQDESLVTLAPKLSRADGFVDFQQPAFMCARRINGLSPWPGVTMLLRDGERASFVEPLKLCRAVEITSTRGRVQPAPATSQSRINGRNTPHGEVPGTLLDMHSGIIACGSGSTIRLIDVQPAGKRIMAWPDFARGRRLTGGERFEHALAPIVGDRELK